ncbi:hypothetical protein F4703DRAFT_1411542 [Phycomyces blakesleeanus]
MSYPARKRCPYKFSARNAFDKKVLLDKSFTGGILTEDIALESIFERPAPAGIATKIDLSTTILWRLDPGVRDAIVACVGAGAGAGQNRQSHIIRKTSTGEYYQLSGFKSATIKRARNDRVNVDERRLISNTLSTRTCNWDQFNEALRYTFWSFEATKGCYSTSLRNLRYHSYRNKQKTLDEMCKRLFTGSIKYREGVCDIQQANHQK